MEAWAVVEGTRAIAELLKAPAEMLRLLHDALVGTGRGGGGCGRFGCPRAGY